MFLLYIRRLISAIAMLAFPGATAALAATEKAAVEVFAGGVRYSSIGSYEASRKPVEKELLPGTSSSGSGKTLSLGSDGVIIEVPGLFQEPGQAVGAGAMTIEGEDTLEVTALPGDSRVAGITPSFGDLLGPGLASQALLGAGVIRSRDDLARTLAVRLQGREQPLLVIAERGRIRVMVLESR